MPDFNPYSTGGLLGQIGYEDVSSLDELFGRTFKDPSDKWAQFLQPSFKLAGEALEELPGQQRGMVGQVTSRLQERSRVAKLRISGAAASTGFAGSGQISDLFRRSGEKIGQEYGSERYRIGQDIQRREAGILAALSGNVSSFLQALLSSGAKLGTAGPGGYTGGYTGGYEGAYEGEGETDIISAFPYSITG